MEEWSFTLQKLHKTLIQIQVFYMRSSKVSLLGSTATLKTMPCNLLLQSVFLLINKAINTGKLQIYLFPIEIINGLQYSCNKFKLQTLKVKI